MGVAYAGRLQPGGVMGGPPPLPGGEASWYMAAGGQPVGPLHAEQLAEAAREGRLRPDTLVWTPGMTSWQPAAQVSELARLFPPPLSAT